MKYIYDEKNGLWYELQDDYYFPCLTLPVEEEKAYQDMVTMAQAVSART